MSVHAMSGARPNGSLLPTAQSAPVIPTGAPQGFGPSGDPWARSGGTPRQCLQPCCSREFSPDRQSQRAEAEESIQRAKYRICSLTGLADSRKANMSGTIRGGNSLVHHGQGQSFGVSPLRAEDPCGGQRVRGAPVEMTEWGIS
jgi:hypothetical protein